MGKRLSVQEPLFDIGRVRYLGRPVPSVIVCQTNGELIATVAPLGWFEGHVQDVTYGEGQWWSRFRPADLTAHDLYKLDGVDFRHLPHPDRTFDTVCFDPPYLPAHGTPSAKAAEFAHRFGLTNESPRAMNTRNVAGAIEAVRVTRPGGFIVAKCCDYTNGSTFRHGLKTMTDALEHAGSRIYDVVIHASGPGLGTNQSPEQIRTRCTHSYLIVARKAIRRTRPNKLVVVT